MSSVEDEDRGVDVGAARQFFLDREARRRTRREADRLHWLQRTRDAVRRIAPSCAGVRSVYIYGSLVQPGRFRPDSDIDVAVESDGPESESAFWRALERELGRDVDVRPLEGRIAEAAVRGGEWIYAGEGARPNQQHSPGLGDDRGDL